MFSVEPVEARTFRLAGELDLASVDSLTDRLLPEAQQDGDLRLDLSALEFIDSSGLRAIITISGALAGHGQLILAAATGEVAEVLTLVRADSFPNVVVEP